jgi:hypothetical protein
MSFVRAKIRCDMSRPSHPAPRVVTIAIRRLIEAGWQKINMISEKKKEKFSRAEAEIGDQIADAGELFFCRRSQAVRGARPTQARRVPHSCSSCVLLRERADWCLPMVHRDH